MAASNAQVQAFVDNTIRPLAEQFRQLRFNVDNALAQIGDVYANLTDNPTWTDGRVDNPPHLATPNDVLAMNTFLVGFSELCKADGNTTTMGAAGDQWPVLLQLCVRSQ